MSKIRRNLSCVFDMLTCYAVNLECEGKTIPRPMLDKHLLFPHSVLLFQVQGNAASCAVVSNETQHKLVFFSMP